MFGRVALYLEVGAQVALADLGEVLASKRLKKLAQSAVEAILAWGCLVVWRAAPWCNSTEKLKVDGTRCRLLLGFVLFSTKFWTLVCYSESVYRNIDIRS